LEWLELFGDDYYIELQRHNIPEQDICNEVLVRWATNQVQCENGCYQ
jgi:DNA polymerase-3 subunit alpha